MGKGESRIDRVMGEFDFQFARGLLRCPEGLLVVWLSSVQGVEWRCIVLGVYTRIEGFGCVLPYPDFSTYGCASAAFLGF